MTIGTLEDIGNNFRSIYEATHYNPTPCPKKNKMQKLYPVQLYSYLSPKIIPWWDNHLNFRPLLQNCFYSDMFRNFMIQGVREALNDTASTFEFYQKQLEKDLDNMTEYLNELTDPNNDVPADHELAYVETRKNIQTFYEKTHFFLTSIYSEQNIRIRQIFNRHFSEKYFDHVIQLEQMYAIIALQGIIGETLPCKALIKASYGNGLDDPLLHKFAKNLKEKFTHFKERQILFNAMHNGLKAIVDYAWTKVSEADIKKNKIPSLGTLENALEEIDPSLFVCACEENTDHLECKKSDHLKWRDSLRPYSEITSIKHEFKDGQHMASRYRFILGEQIGKKTEGDFDHYVYFAIQECYVATRIKSNETEKEFVYDLLIKFDTQQEVKNHDIEKNSLMVISINEAVMGIRHAKASSCYGLNLSQIQFIDTKGRFALVEKLYENHTELVKLIPQLIEWALTSKEIDAPMSLAPLHYPQKFLFDKDTELKVIKLLKPQKFSFQAWEKFIFELSKEDRGTFANIMRASKLYSIAEAEFIRASVLATFDVSLFNPQEQCMLRSFKDENTLKLTLSLQKKMIKLHKSCLKILSTKFPNIFISSDEIQKLLLSLYEKSGGISLLFPILRKEAITAYIQKYNLSTNSN